MTVEKNLKVGHENWSINMKMRSTYITDAVRIIKVIEFCNLILMTIRLSSLALEMTLTFLASCIAIQASTGRMM